MVDGGSLDLFVLLGPTLQDTIRQYVNLTGAPHLPQVSYSNISTMIVYSVFYKIDKLLITIINYFFDYSR